MIESTDTTIRKRSLAEEMAVRLQEQIAQGRFEVGGKLPTESELMKIFGVGRSTVREAVKILANMGLLKVQQGAGTFVESRTARNESMERCMQRADIGDLEEVRRILEVAIVERAAQRRTQADIEKIGTHLAAAGRLNDCIAADVDFHVALSEATHNEILHELYRAASVHLQKRLEHIYTDTGCLLASQSTHERLLRNVVAQEPRKALETIAVILQEP